MKSKTKVVNVNGLEIKLSTRYQTKRKQEKLIKQINLEPVKVIKKPDISKQILIPIQTDGKTVYWVRIQHIRQPKWLQHFENETHLDNHINNIKNAIYSKNQSGN